jgi:hypothetical protein
MVLGIQTAPITVLEYLYIALTALATVHIGKSVRKAWTRKGNVCRKRTGALAWITQMFEKYTHIWLIKRLSLVENIRTRRPRGAGGGGSGSGGPPNVQNLKICCGLHTECFVPTESCIVTDLRVKSLTIIGGFGYPAAAVPQATAYATACSLQFC